jgi:hypothetical protein
MSTTDPRPLDREDIEQLLPWYQTGKLGDAEKARVEAFLAKHEDVARQLRLVAEEQEAVETLNEAAGHPRAGALDRLMSAIEAEGDRAPWLTRLTNAAQSLLDKLAERSLLVPVAAFAAAVIILQTGAVGTLLWERPSPATYQTASVATAPTGAGTFALAAFTPTATAEEIGQTLAPLGVTIADGPKPGGIYRLRLGGTSLSDKDRDKIIAELKANSHIIRVVALEAK